MTSSETNELVDWKLGIAIMPLPSKSKTQQYVLLYEGKQYKTFNKWDTAEDYFNKLRKTLKQKQTKGPIS
jgi:hypothetical protein